MEDLFTLDQDTLDTVEAGINSLIHQLGKPCKIIYEPDKLPCTNCYLDVTSDTSTGVYNQVGPKPFTIGKCPVCKGKGYLPTTGLVEETVQFLIDWQPKPWAIPYQNSNTQLPAGIAQTKGFIADMPRVIQAKYIIIDYTNVGLTHNKFVKYGEPVIVGNILKSRYFICFWQRYGS